MKQPRLHERNLENTGYALLGPWRPRATLIEERSIPTVKHKTSYLLSPFKPPSVRSLKINIAKYSMFGLGRKPMRLAC